MRFLLHLTALLVSSVAAWGATFGSVVPIVGGAAGIVLDEPRGRLYLVNTSQTRIEVYSIAQRRFLAPIRTEALPLAAALSRDGRTLYVVCHDASALNVIDVETLGVTGRVSLPAKPEGVAVGNDGRVLVSTIGTGANNVGNVLLVYDPGATATVSVSPVTITPPAPANPLLPAPSGRIFLASRSQLIASADGSTIIGVNIPNANSRAVFVYEVASGTVLRSRTVANVSSVLSVSPNGKRFMAGLNLFDTDSLEILAQQNTANAPYPFQTGVNFNVQQNQGGSVFSADGATIYSAFNIAPVQVPAARANVAQLMLNDPDNLLIRMALQLPENLAGAMVISGDGANIYALSESGFVILPIGAMSQSPIATPESTVVLLANDQCGLTQQQRASTVPVRNDGRGRFTLTAQVLQTTPTGPVGIGGIGGPGGGAPGGGVIIIPTPPGGGPIVVPPGPVLPGGNVGQQNPAIAGTAPSARTSLNPNGAQIDFGFTAAPNARNPGTVSPPHTFLLQSNEAVNIPPAVKVLQNFRDTEARSELVAIEVGLTANEGLEDMVYDPGRQRIYIANSGMNRVEVFDIRSRTLMRPIKVGQLPRTIAMTPDGGTLYVGNTGGESISVVDLEKLEQVGRIRFPPLPFNIGAAVMTPSIIAASQRGALVLMNNGTIWRLVGNEIVPRAVSALIGSATVPAPRTMVSTPNGENIMLLAGNGFVYLYDALADEFVQGRQIFSNPITGFYGPVAAGPRGQYFVANGSVLNQALTPTSSAGTTPDPGPVRPGQPVTQVGRPISAVAAASGNTFVRFAQPIRANANAAATEAPVVEMVDANTAQVMRSAAALEGPASTVVGNQRVNVNGRTMAVDASGSTVYALTASGLSIVSLEVAAVQDRPQVSQGGVVSTASYTPAIAQGGLISIFGRSLGNTESFPATPLPQILGGTCVTLNNQPLPLLMTSTGQINAQIPPELAPGRYPLIVRSVDRKASSLPQLLTVAKYAPSVFVNPETSEAAIFHSDGRAVSKRRPAKRDEMLMLFVAGLGPTKGGRVISGTPAPAEPLAITDTVQVFFGDARYNEAEQIVEWSGLVPGLIGVYQINLRVPGHRIRGEELPVTVRIGGVNSQTTGPAVPIIAVE